MEPNDLSQLGRGLTRVLLHCVVMAMGAQITMANAADLTPHDLILLDRLTFGVSASSAAHLQAAGAERWLNEQLHPPANSALPQAAQSLIEPMADLNKSAIEILSSFDAQAKSANQVADPDQRKAAQQVYQQAMNERMKQAQARSVLHALYAPDQLRQRMTWFWFNHFNVHQYKANLRILIGD